MITILRMKKYQYMLLIYLGDRWRSESKQFQCLLGYYTMQ